jgi:hypothetical protein
MFNLSTRTVSRLLPALVAMAGLNLAGCANMAPSESGFMHDYGTLKPVDGNDKLRVYQGPTRAQYKALMIDPVQWQVNARNNDDISEGERLGLTKFFDDKLHEKLNGYPLATGPGPNVLRVRAVITDVKTSSPAANVVLTALLIGPLDNGGASVEIEATDSLHQERIAAMTASETGGFISTGGFSKLGHAENALVDLAGEFASTLK